MEKEEVNKSPSTDNGRKSWSDRLKGLQKDAPVYAVFGLAFAIAMWLIFAPSAKREKGVGGFNIEMPDADSETIEGDKRKAYATADLQKRQEEKRKARNTGDVYGV